MSGTRSYYFFSLLVGFLLLGAHASAEPVLINSGAQAKGQGWLFGSPKDASCWIATPRHVVEATRGGVLAGFRWTDARGREGRGIDPIAPDPKLDLAFARAEGRADGACLSRLGGDDLTFIVKRQPAVEAMSMQKTHVEPRRMVLRDFSGDYVRFAPADNEAKEYMKPGLSGSPLVLRESDGRDRPIGLIASVDSDQRHGYAVRFDAIKRLFLTLDTATTPESERDFDATHKKTQFSINDASGVSRDASTTAQAVLNDDQCWIAHPAEEARSFSAVIMPEKRGGSFKRIALIYDSACAQAPDAVVLEKRSGDGWATLAACNASPTGASCLSAGQPLDQMRLTVISRSGAEVAIRKIEIVE
jgi:hypothetical protein